MDKIDIIVNACLKRMGVDTSKEPQWIPDIHIAKDQTTGEVVRTYPNGFICSYCGMHSWWKKERCDGCNSSMLNK